MSRRQQILLGWALILAGLALGAVAILAFEGAL